jgi:hypothetical protein
MRFSARFHIPREHGAWGMYLVSFLAGALGAGRWSQALIWLGIATLMAFLARDPLLYWLRCRRRGRPAGTAAALALAEAGGSMAAAGVLLLAYDLWGLLPLLAAALVLSSVHLGQAIRGRERSLPGEGVAILGVTLSAPAARYSATGAWDPACLWLWGLCFLFFASSVFYVRLRVGTSHPGKRNDIRRRQRQCALYHAALCVGLLLLIWAEKLSLLAGLAFAAILVRAAWFLIRPTRELNLRHVGYLEAGYSLLFLVLMAMAFRPL